MSSDLIGLLEAAYSLEGDDQSWLARVTAAAHPVIERGLGTVAYFFSVDEESGALEIDSPIVLEAPVPVEVIREYNRSLSTELVAILYLEAPPCGTAAAALRRSLRQEAVYNRTIRPHHDVPDALGLRANSAPREGVFFTAPLARIGGPTRSEATLFSRLGSHIGAGLRLRRRLRAEAAPLCLDDAEAILTPDGRVEHAGETAKARPARRALAQAARAVDRARGRLRHADPDEAVALWRALVAGRWSLVDHFDHDGRRFVVAHRNQLLDPALRVRALSERERQVAALAALGHSNKLIAYDLGVALSTVSDYLARAAAKLGTRSRVGLVQAMRALPKK